MQRLLRQQLDSLRSRGYQELRELASEQALQLHEIRGSTGRRYGIEVSIQLDGEQDTVRVVGSIDDIPPRRLFGFLPLYVGGFTDGFFVARPGSAV